MDNADLLSRNLEVLSDPCRAMLFRRLARDPDLGATLDRLQQITRLDYTALILHLRVMERGQIIHRHRDGPHVSYRISTGDLTPALAAAIRLGEAARSGPRRAA